MSIDLQCLDKQTEQNTGVHFDGDLAIEEKLRELCGPYDVDMALRRINARW